MLLDKYKEFKAFVTEKTRYGFHITKHAGVFIVKKDEEQGIKKYLKNFEKTT